MKVYIVFAVDVIESIEDVIAGTEGFKSRNVDSIWFTEEDAYERVDQLELDETNDWDYFEVEAMEVHGKEHLKVISKVIDNERKEE